MKLTPGALVVCCGLLFTPAWGQDGTESAESAAAAEGAYRDCVVVVLDASGSMGNRMGRTSGTRMEAAKEALKRVLAGLPATTHVGVLVFSGHNVRSPRASRSERPLGPWVWPLGPRGTDAQLAAAIDPIEPGGGTPLGAFLKVGADQLLRLRGEQFGYGSYRLLVVTDGEAGDPQLVSRYAPDVVARGIAMDVIGVDMDRDHTLKTLAHSYRRADDPRSLQRAVEEVFAEVTAGSAAGAAGVGESAFEVTAGLEPQLALAIISALAGSGNHAIGEQPPERVEPEEQPGDDATGRPKAADKAPGAPGGSASPPPSPSAPGGSDIPWRPVFFILIVATVLYVVWRKKKR